ncbi:probable E3 ubiquitin-protein ligase TRIML1 [Sarcophilus harrisii]|uniref:probable E3 ubiquitin-protein ligase TRIML1 n=1 Tax=Sarcophilus harrisii TaxID=9305 RepID=UPI001302037B|nr:probable E3 ubiquitin-protein ligase TRIML1 [Sarcophilus harrisii]
MAAIELTENFSVDLTCSICLSYFTDPVVVDCGHSFCRKCLFRWFGESSTPEVCPECRTVISVGDILCNKNLQNLAITGKLLRFHLPQNIRNLTICDAHEKEETLFCEDDHRFLCWTCFLTTNHKEHKVLSLEGADGQCVEKLRAIWNILRKRKEKFQNDLKYEKLKELHYKVEGQTLKESVIAEYEKMYQLLLEEEQLHLQRLDKEARNNLTKFQKSKVRFSQKIYNCQMMILEMEENFERLPILKQKPQRTWNTLRRKKEQLQTELECEKEKEAQCILDYESMKQLVVSEYENKHQFFLEKEQLHLQRLTQEARGNLAKFEESQSRLSQKIQNLQVLMSEVEDNFEVPLIEFL